MAAFAGASIAKSDPMRTGFTALKFSAFLFIIPLLFIYTPIMMPEGLTVQAVQAMVTSFLAVAAAAAALSSFLLCRTTLAERARRAADRQSVVSGKGVRVRVDLGGVRII